MRRFLLLLILPLLLVSCTAVMDPMADADESKSVFYASVERVGTPETKVYADENLKVLWNADDRISLFEKTTYNYQYKFLGEDGDTAGDFEKMPVSGFIAGNPVAHYCAVYPYSKSNKLKNDESFTITLPAEQAWKDHSFGIGANTMVAISEDNFMSFKNVGGYLQLRFYGDGINVNQITLAGNNGEKIAGKAIITIAPGEAPTIKEMDATATNEITLVCNPAVALGASAEQYTEFWFVVPPVTFSKGFTVTVTDDKKNTFTKQTSKSFTVTRNKLDWMNPILVDMD